MRSHTFPITNVTTTSYNATGFTPSNTYNWYVVPKNSAGAATGCISNSTSFTTAAIVPEPAGTGLQGVYYNGTALAGTPLLTRVDPTINMSLTYSTVLSPAPGIVPEDKFSVRWTGQIKPTAFPGSGVQPYTFGTTSDDGIRLWIDGKLLIDNWTDQGPTSKIGTINLENNKKYNIKIEYYENTGESTAKLSWSSPVIVGGLVPQGNLYPDGYSEPAPAGCASLVSPPGNITPTTATLSWQPAANAISYDVYLYPTATPMTASPIANVDGLSYNATGLTASTQYSWYLIPRNSAGTPNNSCFLSQTTFITAAPANLPGIPNAGGDTTITLPASSVALDASASTGSIVQYYWYQVQGPVQAVIVNNFSAVTTATGLTAAGKYIFGLQVKDNNGVLKYATKTVTVKAAAPAITARAADPSLNETSTALLKTADNSSLPSISAVIGPNPVTSGNQAKLQINSSKAGVVMINTVNSYGAIIGTKKVNLVAGINTTTVSTTGLAQGFHVISISGAAKPLNLKLVVQ